jgi:hypothetical protein
MTLKTYPELVQGSDEWLAARRGLVTASTVGQLITVRKLGAIDYGCPDCLESPNNPCTSKRTGDPIKTLHPARAEYARSQASSTVIEPASNDVSRGLTMLLAAERITGWSEPSYINFDMERGLDCEPKARDLYSQKYAPVTELGFMVLEQNGYRLGFSPDGLVGDDGLIEVKAPRAKGHLATILAGHPPLDYMPQLQCGLLVSGRKWIDFVSFSGGMPLWVQSRLPRPVDGSAQSLKPRSMFEQNVDRDAAHLRRGHRRAAYD